METLNGELASIGVASRALQGQSVSGDTYVVAPFPGGLLVAAIDGLGHGREASIAGKAAAESILSCAHETVLSVIQRCHECIHHTRGVVMSVASFNAVDSTMTWLAVGNVEAYLLRADLSSREKPYILMRGGVIGHSLPPLRAEILVVSPGDTLVMATDGIRSGFSSALESKAPPQEIADTIMTRFSRDTDDALVIVVRWLGGSR